MRVALCITELERGGAEQCLVELATRLDRRQFDPVVYCLGPRPASNPRSLVDLLEQAGIEVVCFGGRGAIDAPRVLWQLRRRMQRDRPQLVQTFLFHANLLGAAAARWAGVPCVVSGIRVAERDQKWHLRWARFGDRWIDRHVCVSQGVRQFSLQHAGLSDSKLVVIPNGVDVTRFASATPVSLLSLGLAPSRRAMICIGRLDVQKGLRWLLTLMPEIFARLPEHDLLVVGDGPLRGELDTMVCDNPQLKGRVHLLGFCDDVPHLLAASDLLLLPSAWEGMPNVVLEAMAAAKPVVATDVEGVSEALGSLAAEQCVPGGATVVAAAPSQGDESQLFVEKVVAIASDSALASQLGQQNQLRARECFGFEAMVAAYRDLYLALLDGRQTASKK